MPTPQDLEKKFWKALKSDMTVMLGLDGVEGGHARPMTAQTEEEGNGPIWFFTAKDTALVQKLSSTRAPANGENQTTRAPANGNNRAIATFASKDHDLFATIHGSLSEDTNRAMIEKLWNPFVAAWYKGGKDDPKLVLLRLDAEEAEIWENANSLIAGVKMLFGMDPKKDYKDKVARVNLKQAS